MRWLNFFLEDYINTLNITNEMRKSEINSDAMCAQYVKMFIAACNLLKLYLNYNGLFQFEQREVIKEAFYVELIDDGERWINALSLVDMFMSGERTKFNNLILSYCEDENFYIFESLKNKFEKIKEKYEKAS